MSAVPYLLASVLVLLTLARAAAVCRRAARWARENVEADKFIAELRAVA